MILKHLKKALRKGICFAVCVSMMTGSLLFGQFDAIHASAIDISESKTYNFDKGTFYTGSATLVDGTTKGGDVVDGKAVNDSPETLAILQEKRVAGWAFTEQSDDGNGVLCMGTKSALTYTTGGAFRLHNKTDGFYLLEPSCAYSVTFRFKVQSAESEIYRSDNTLFTHPDSVYYFGWDIEYGGSVGSKQTGNGLSYMGKKIAKFAQVSTNKETFSSYDQSGNKSTLNIGQWYTVTYQFSTPDTMPISSHIGFTASNYYQSWVYVDDVTVSKCEAITTEVGNGSISKTVYPATEGEPIALETPTRYGADFAGWYSDPECTTPFTDTVFTKENKNTHVYAKWDDIHFGFESYVPNEYTFGFAKNIFFEITDKQVCHGKKSVMYHYTSEYYNRPYKTDPNTGVVTSYYSSRRISRENCMPIKPVKSDTTYVISYRYYFEPGAESDISLCPATASANFWESANYVLYSASKNTIGCGQTGKWLYGRTTFTTDTLTTYGTNLILQINAASAADVVVYFDDISVYELNDTCDILLDAGEGSFNDGTHQKAFAGKMGDSLATLEMPQHFGYDFAGWYYDAACTRKMTDTVITAENYGAVLFAAWTRNNGFESYSFNIKNRDSCQFYFGKRLSLVQNEAFEGNTSLKMYYDPTETGMDNRYASPDNVVSLTQLENQTRYLITFCYKVEGATTPLNVDFYSMSTNIWESKDSRHYTSVYSIPASCSGNGWYVGQVVLTTDFKKSLSGTYCGEYSSILAAAVSTTMAKPYTVYFDNFTFTPYSEDDGAVIYFDAANKTKRVVMGKIGDPIEYISEKLDGKRFMGWHIDPGCTTPYMGNGTLQAIPTLLYCNWQSGESFENYKATHSINQFTFGPRLSITTASEEYPANSGNTFARMNYVAADDPDDDRYPGSCDNMIILQAVSTQKYAITFNYRVVSAETNIKIALRTCTNGNIWSTSGKGVTYAQRQYIDKREAGTGWHKATIVIDAKPVSGGEYLYLYINSFEKKDYMLDIDDIIITPVDSNMAVVSFVADNDCGTNGTSVGIKGETIEFPYITQGEGLAFYGWYTDSACKNVFLEKKYSNDGTVYARYESNPITTITFDDYPEGYVTDQKIVASAALTDSGRYFEKQNSLTFTTVKSQTNVFPMATAAGAVNLQSNTSYVVNFEYTSTALASTDYTGIQFFTASADNCTVNRKNCGTATRVVYSPWSKRNAMFVFTTGTITTDATALYLEESNCSWKDMVVYIDNVSVTRIDSGRNFIFGYDGRNKKDYFSFGTVGMPCDLTTPEDTDYFCFDGWYEDAALTTRFDGVHKNATTSNAYARWCAKTVDFENYYFKDNNSRYVVGTDCSVVQGKDCYQGHKMLQYSFAPATNYFGTSNNTAELTLVDDKTTYCINFHYRMEAGDSDVQLKFLTAHNGTRWSFITNYDKSTYTIRSTECGEGWKEGTVYLTTDFYNESSNGLYVTFNPLTEDTCVVDLDEVEVTYVEKGNGAVAFLGKDETSAFYSAGRVGSSVQAPIEKPVGYHAAFNGWYTDVSCTTPFMGTTVNEGLTYVYSGWTEATETFENYGYRSTAARVWSDRLVIDTDGSNKALEFTTDSAVSDTSVRFRIGIFENNTTYRVNFRYKTENAGTTLNFLSAYEGDASRLTTLYNDEGMFYTVSSGEADGVWHNATIYMTTGFAYSIVKNDAVDTLINKTTVYGSMLYGYFTATGAGAMSIDDITFTAIEALYEDGHQVLSEEAAAESGDQAMRVRFGYCTTDSTTLTIDGKPMLLTERGVIFKNAINSNTGVDSGDGKLCVEALTLSNTAKNGYAKTSRTYGFGSCWDYYTDRNMVIFSSYINGFRLRDDRLIGARGYIKVKDEDGRIYTFYSSDNKTTVVDVSKLAAEYTDVSVHTFAGVSWDHFTVVNPKVMAYIYGMQIEELLSYASGKGVMLTRVNEKAAESIYEIIIGDTTRAASSLVNATGENGYVIAVRGTKVIIKGVNDIATMQGVKDFMKMMKLKDTLHCGAKLQNGYTHYGTYQKVSNDYAMTFDDEFDSELMSKYWGSYGGQTMGNYTKTSILGGNIDYRNYGDPAVTTATGEQKELVRLEDGHLVLASAHMAENENDVDFAKSALSTFYNMIYQYGCLEIRAKTQPVICQSFWINGSSSTFEGYDREARGNFGEYDLLENYGSPTYAASAVHQWWSPAGTARGHYSFPYKLFDGTPEFYYKPDSDETDITDVYHIYSFVWTDEGLTFAFDGIKQGTLHEDETIKNRMPNYLILSAGMGSATYGMKYQEGVHEDYYENYIDYVRIYQVEDMGSRMLLSTSCQSKQ